MISNPQEQLRESTLDKMVEELCDQMQAGKLIELDSLIKQYPEMEDRLRVIYPMVQAMANWSASDAATGPHLMDDQWLGNREIGDFQILRQIGRGGMGVVYEAQQLSIPRKVALKILPLAALVDSRALQRFKNEVAAIATLQHPHIVAVYSIGEERGIHYFAMQLIHGQSLAAVIRELRVRTEQDQLLSGDALHQAVSSIGNQETAQDASGSKLSVSQKVGDLDETIAETVARGRSSTVRSVGDATYFRNVARLIQQAAEALQHAHDHGIVHRDVKPGNLLLDAHGTLFVTDFGLARIETGAGVTMTGDILGTLRYMSPEQVLANRMIVDHRTDVYSIGATLYELLTLQPMWNGENKAGLIRQISFEEPVRPQKINPAIPPDLETIVLKATSKNPGDRYDNAQFFADDLQRWVANKPIIARRPTVFERLTKWTTRHRGMVIVALVGCFLLSITLSVATIFVWRESQRRISALVGEQTAKLQADLANKRMATINDFVLRNIVQSGNPLSEDGSLDISVRDSLLAANNLIADTFKDDALLRSHVEAILGDYLGKIGEYEAARKNLEDSLSQFVHVYGKENAYTIDCMRDLTKVYRHTGELDLASSMAKDVVGVTRQFYGPTDRVAVDSVFNLGVVFRLQKAFADAEGTLIQAIELAQAGELPLHEALATNELGSTSFDQQRFEKAESYWLSALAMFEELDSRFNIIAAKSNLEKVYWQTGRQQNSVALMEQVVGQLEELVGPTHPETLAALGKLASRRFYLKDVDNSIKDYRQLLDRTRSKYGPQHEKTALASTDLGSALQKAGEFNEAIRLQKVALEILKREYGEQHAKVIFTLGALALSYSQNGEIDNASDCFRQAIESRLAIADQQPDNWENAVSLGGLYCNLGNLLQSDKQRLEDAIDNYSDAIEVLERVNLRSPTDKGKRFLHISRENRASAFAKMENWDLAIADSEKAVLETPLPALRDGALLRLARITAMSGKPAAANDIVEDVATRTDDETDFYLAACVMAMCAEHSKNPDNLSGLNPSTAFDDYARRCIYFLEESHKRSYFRFQNRKVEFLKDQDFESIRHLEEFKEFCQRIDEADRSKVDPP